MAFLAPLAAALIPLLIAPGFLFYYDLTPKIALLLLAAGVALPWSVAGGRRPAGWFSLLLAAQLLSLAISTAVSAEPRLSLGGTSWRRFGLITHASLLVFAWILAATPATGPARKTLFRGIAATGVLIALYTILQYFGWDPWIPAGGYHIGEGVWTIVRPPGTLGHAAYAATWLLLVVFLAVALRRIETDRWWRRLALVAIILAVTAIVLSGTRAALAGLAAGGVLLVWGRRWQRRWLAIAGGVVFALVVFYYSPAGQGLRSRMRWAIEDPRGGARLLLWRDALAMGGTRWLAGWGPETFPTVFPRRQSRELARAYPDFQYESPHNMFVDAFVSQGAIGALVLLAISFAAFAAARSNSLGRPLAAALAATIASQMFNSFIPVTALGFYLLVGLVAPDRRPEVRPPAWRPALWCCLPVSALLVACAIRLLAADRGTQIVRERLEVGRIEEAVGVYDRSRFYWNPGANPDLWYSRSLVEAARRSDRILVGARALETAFQAALRASLEADERHNAGYNLAAFHALRNDAAGVERSLREAIAWAPNWYKPHWALAQALGLAGRGREALAEAALAVELDAGKHPEVARTLDELRGGK